MQVREDNTVIWILDRDTFSHTVQESAIRRRERHEKFLTRVPLLKGFLSRCRLAVIVVFVLR